MNLTLWKSFAIWCASVLLVVQYILAFFVLKLPGYAPLQWLGWGICVLSLIFGIGPIFSLRRWGGVAKGRSYIHTTRLVDTSLYAIVRHPQYLSGFLFSLAMMLVAQHWLVILVGIASIGLFYLDGLNADQEGLDKFGDEYRDYMYRVPKMNFLLGILRLLEARCGGMRR